MVELLSSNETLLEKSLKLYRPLSAIRDARLLKPAFAFSFPVKWPTVQDAMWELLQLDAAEARSRSREDEQRLEKQLMDSTGSVTALDLARQ